MTKPDEDEEVGTLEAVVGERIRTLRVTAGRGQDDIATAARSFGLEWVRSTVGAIENGQRQLLVREFVLLPLVLGAALGHVPELADLVGGGSDAAWIRLTDETRATRADLGAILEGHAKTIASPLLVDAPVTREHFTVAGERGAALGTYRDRLWPGGRLQEIDVALREASGETERKAARKLGMPAEDLSVTAHRMWSLGFAAERDRRVAEKVEPGAAARSVQAVRAHVTRDLLTEVSEFLRGEGRWAERERETDEVLAGLTPSKEA